MTVTRHIFGTLILVAMSTSPPSAAMTLTIYVAPSQEGMKLQAIEVPNNEEIEIPLKEQKGDRQVFILDDSIFGERQRGGPFLAVDLVAFRPASEAREQITVRIPLEVPRRASVRLFLTEPKLAPEAITNFRNRGLKGDGAYRTYFEARKVFRGIRAQNSRHPLIIPAAFWYFTAAYELARYPESVVAMDEEAIEASRDVLTRAKTDKLMAQGFKRFGVDRSHWLGMLPKAERLEWRNFSLVQQAANLGHFDEAAELNLYFAQQFEQLDPAKRIAIAREYGINRRLLANNKKFLAAKRD